MYLNLRCYKIKGLIISYESIPNSVFNKMIGEVINKRAGL